MESNNPNLPVNPSGNPIQPQQTVSHPINNQRGNLPIIIGVLVLLLIVGGGGYYLGTQNSRTAPQARNTNAQPTITPQNNTVTDSTEKPITTDTDESANWKSFTSKMCGLSLKTPQTWSVNDTKGTDTVGYDFTCTTLAAPDFKFTGMDTAEGLNVGIHRTPIGSTFKTVKINTLEDYIVATETIQEPMVPAKSVQNKSFGKFNGKYFEYAAFENTSNFIFIQENYIYTVTWNADYQGIYKDDINGIVSSLAF